MSDMYDVKTRIPHGQVHKVRKDGSLDVASVNDEPTMAQQQYRDECDINNIMKKYASTGSFQCAIKEGGAYADFSMITDYKDMLDTVRYADEAFMKLPAELRKRFDNDPAQLLSFIQDDKNYDEAFKLGIVNERPKKTSPSTTTINDDEGKSQKGASKDPPASKDSTPKA